jgi:hypothetical protein
MRKIEFKVEKDGEITFQPVAGNGEGQGISEPYSNLSNVKRGAHDLLGDDEELEFVRVLEHRDDDRKKDKK